MRTRFGQRELRYIAENYENDGTFTTEHSTMLDAQMYAARRAAGVLSKRAETLSRHPTHDLNWQDLAAPSKPEPPATNKALPDTLSAALGIILKGGGD